MVTIDVEAAGVSFPEVLQTPGRVPVQAGAAVRARRRGRRASCAARPRARAAPGDRVAAMLHARRLRRDRRRARVPDVPAARRARLRAGRGADPQLPHGLLLAGARAAGSRRARPCSSTARRAASAPRRSRSPRASARADRRRLRRREGGASRARPAPTRSLRSDGPWKDEVQRGRRRRHRHRPGRRRPLHRLAALAAARRPARRRRLHRRRRSPRSRSTACCSTTPTVVGAGWGAYVISKPAVNARDPGARSTS